MKKELAEKLLTKVMDWSDREKSEKRLLLDALADYKYDDYEQFAPGRRFVESFALWLSQFKSLRHRQIAYTFVIERLVFISAKEVSDLVGLVFPTVIRKYLIQDTALELKIDKIYLNRIINSLVYKKLRRRTLILGLSDGAHIDQFRRSNPSISNEQVYQTYEVSESRLNSMMKELENDMSILEQEADKILSPSNKRFKYMVLLDDFTGSGKTYIRKEKKDQEGPVGKIPKILNLIQNIQRTKDIFCDDMKIIVVILIASHQAKTYLEKEIETLNREDRKITLHFILTLPEETRLDKATDSEIFELIEDPDYVDKEANDRHLAIGEVPIKYGFADCRLPLILNHNTPNNSINLLHAEEKYSETTGKSCFRGLFPRVSRHREIT